LYAKIPTWQVTWSTSLEAVTFLFTRECLDGCVEKQMYPVFYESRGSNAFREEVKKIVFTAVPHYRVNGAM
jgi:hypothetical protein